MNSKSGGSNNQLSETANDLLSEAEVEALLADLPGISHEWEDTDESQTVK